VAAAPHKLFDARPGLHGELHGGLIVDRTPSPSRRPTTAVGLRESVARKYLTLAAAPPPAAVDFSTAPWWNSALEQDDQQTLGACVSFSGDHFRRVLSLQVGHADQKHSQL